MIYKLSIKKKDNFSILKKSSGYFLKGHLGLSLPIPYNRNINIIISDSFIVIESLQSSYFFLYKRLFLQKIRGVSYGYKKRLKLTGVGYIATVSDHNLILKLGFSSAISIKILKNIYVIVKKRKLLTILGCDLNQITQFSAIIRSYRPPEVYKGKGVLYFKEKVSLKVGKRN